MTRGRRQKSESRSDLIVFLILKIQKDSSVLCFEVLCVSLRIKLKDEVGPSNDSARGRAASRSPNAADSPPTFGVSSKCGMEKEGGKSRTILILFRLVFLFPLLDLASAAPLLRTDFVLSLWPKSEAGKLLNSVFS